MGIVIYPYKMGSKSGKVLANALNVRRVYTDGEFRNNYNHLIVNWGNSTTPRWLKGRHLNPPFNVSLACNKGISFSKFNREGVAHPEYTFNTEQAQQWLDDGDEVYGRKTLTGHSGQGIIIFNNETICSSMECPLYTKAVKKDKEYRVHVFNGEVIDYQQKKKKLGHEGGVRGIRNFTNGWIYARSDVLLPEDVKEEAIKAVSCLGLDFGAVDICTVRGGGVSVFEVNTACGLEGTTIEKYVNAIRVYHENT
jgi:glutathione synthase/RimK-type ligase-like ATP-grasp enzyme